MKKLKLLLALFATVGTMAGLTACGEVDYVSQVHLDASLDYKSKNFLDNGIGQVTIRKFVDGDTTHFNQEGEKRVVKVRYAGVDTPESTGQIEPYGKKASRHTKETLENAKTIVLTNDIPKIGTPAALDSTGGRYIGFVWYSEKENCPVNELKLLNLKIVQEGLSYGKSIKDSPLSEYFTKADMQAQQLKRNLYSGEKDPEFYDGDPYVTTLKEINETYEEDGSDTSFNGALVQFEGIVYKLSGTYDAYVFDQIDGVKYSMYIFAGYKSYTPLKKLGARIRVIGTYTLFMGNPQITNVHYDNVFPDEKKDLKIISTDNPYTIDEKTVTEVSKRSSINLICTIEGLTCYSGKTEIDTTSLLPSGALTLRCKDASNLEMSVRIPEDVWALDEGGSRVTDWEYFKDRIITITGAVNFFAPDEADPDNGYYQMRLCAKEDISSIAPVE